MATKSFKIMFLGAPGAGKGTYASRIAPMMHIPTISTGDLVRHEIKTGTALGAKIEAYNNSGALVPDKIILDMMETRLAQDDAKRGFILDGFPRNVPQAQAFQHVTELDLVVNIHLPQWILLDKISGRRVCTKCGSGYNVAFIKHGKYHMPPLLPKVDGICDFCGAASLVQRPDDTPETVKQRLKVYNQETAPLIDFYTQLGNLRTFEVKKGLADLSKLVDLINKKLYA
ncbi:adenylate kinase [Plasmopara halstedii]|uniref:Adenylate kinase n=1 Tax=Plasmopara halstedii TaxID=4781 RepID=A0A0P1AVN0_PLAHL|nr:adenylate kinase [Plasmopara halstedii]CEG44650.1 adenylate kinase [Plasmopara halstedii]|eukprot:XP_024581019.1 adenylate kinase [Plasmopara halstedii]